MPPSGGPAHGAPGRVEVGLRWLTRLRWGSAAGQLVTVLAARFALGLDVPLGPLLGLIAVTVLSNLLVVSQLGHLGAFEERIAGGLLATDTVSLAAMLRLTGGPLNPFSILFIVYITLAAVLLGRRWTWFLAGLSVAAYGALFFSYRPLGPLALAHEHAGLALHLQGMWWAFCVAAGLTAYFVVQLAAALERREGEIAEVREQAARNERLASLTTLAAGAAHELGTPLGTIAVAARELERALETLAPEVRDAMTADVGLIRSELLRCRHILDEMSARAGENAGECPERVTLDVLVAETLKAFPDEVAARVKVDGGLGSLSVRAPQLALVRAVSNLVRNALEASGPHGTITLAATSAEGWLRLGVTDRGPGMPESVLAHAGEPFFSTKPAGGGLGLGLFLARTLMEGLGGRLRIESTPGGGTAAWLEMPDGGST
jgi:two-component system, sensor histidine kinase RegB